MNNDGSWGITHLSGMPITMTFGLVLLGVLLALVLFRFLFADVSIRGGVR